MQVNKRFSFCYSQNDPNNISNRQVISSQHIVNSAKILRFNYQLPLQPREEKLIAYPSARIETSTTPASIRPEDSVKSSKKIKLIIANKRKLSEKMKEFPYFESTQLKVNKSHKESESLSLHNKQEQKQEESKIINPQLKFPQQRNHISMQYPKNCGLFSCGEPLHDQANYERENFQSIRQEESVCHRIQLPQDERVFPLRQKIFSLHEKEEQTKHLEPYRYSTRRKMFSEMPPSRKMFKIAQEFIIDSDIPIPIAENWSKLQEVKQWQEQTQNASPQWQNSPNNFSDIQLSS